jgi:hypothetical protein
MMYLDSTLLMGLALVQTKGDRLPKLDPLRSGWATLSPNSPRHVKNKKLGCSIENLKKILKYTEQVFSKHVNFDYSVTTAIKRK